MYSPFNFPFSKLSIFSSTSNEYEIINLNVKPSAEEEDKKMLGRRLELKWTSGKWYRGTVCKFDATKKKHFVVYDDGDERWYNLSEMVFRFVKDEDEWIAVNKDI